MLDNSYWSLGLSLYISFPHDAYTDTPNLSQDSVGSFFMCIHNTLHSMYCNTYHSIFSLFVYFSEEIADSSEQGPMPYLLLYPQ